jgi:Flp pilus assembly protein TadG
VGGVAGGASAIADSVHKKQAAAAALAEAERAARVKEAEDAKKTKEAERHNREVEAQLRNAGGKGLYLGRQTTGGCCPRCKGSGLYLGKKN